MLIQRSVLILIYTSFGGSFTQLCVVYAKSWSFEGWLRSRSRFQVNDLLLHIPMSVPICRCWKAIEITHPLVVVFLNFELFWRYTLRYDNNGWSTSCTLLILLWLGVVNIMMELDGGRKKDKSNSRWEKRELRQLYWWTPSSAQQMIAIDVNNMLEGKQVKRNIIS